MIRNMASSITTLSLEAKQRLAKIWDYLLEKNILEGTIKHNTLYSLLANKIIFNTTSKQNNSLVSSTNTMQDPTHRLHGYTWSGA